MWNSETVFSAKLAELMHHAFVRIRTCTDSPIPGDDEKHCAELHDLADLLHNLPLFIVGLDDHAAGDHVQFRSAVVRHVSKFFPAIDPNQHRYVRLLDMDDDEFLTRHRVKSDRLAAAAS